jgi:RNA polymerase sigma-70 factor (ECF subfamily)
MLSKEKQEELMGILGSLTEEQKEVLKMRIYMDYSFKEIAEMTQVSINTALGRMRYALMNMRRLAKEHNIALQLDC